MTLTHHTFYDGRVQSIGFQREAMANTVAVLLPGVYSFRTSSPERMTVLSGSYRARLPGQEWRSIVAAAAYEVPGDAGFELDVKDVAVHLCEYLAPASPNG